MPAARSTTRSRARRLRVRIRRATRSAFEVAAFLGAGLSAVVQLLTGRLPAPRRPKAPVPATLEPPRCEHTRLAPYPIQD
jgi:hypothetical protein